MSNVVGYPPGYYQAQPVQRPRKRHRFGIGLLTALVVLAGAAVGADRLAVNTVERNIVTNLTQNVEGGTITGMDVQIKGFPFLTQVLHGELNDVTGSMAEGMFGGVEVRDAHFAATGVGTGEPFHAQQATADALVPYSTMANLLGQQVAGLVDDVQVTADPSLVGALDLTGSALGMPVGITAVPTVGTGNNVHIAIEQVTISGEPIDATMLPFGIGEQLQNINFPLDLPHGITLTGISTEPDGMRIHAEAQNVDLETIFEQ